MHIGPAYRNQLLVVVDKAANEPFKVCYKIAELVLGYKAWIPYLQPSQVPHALGLNRGQATESRLEYPSVCTSGWRAPLLHLIRPRSS